MKFCVLNIYNLYLDELNFIILVQIIEIFFVKQHKTGKNHIQLNLAYQVSTFKCEKYCGRKNAQQVYMLWIFVHSNNLCTLVFRYIVYNLHIKYVYVLMCKKGF